MEANSAHVQVDWMYFVAFAGTAIGLVIYSYKYCVLPVFCSLDMDRCIAMILYWCQYSPLKKLLQAGAQSRLLKRLHRLQGPVTRRPRRQTAQHKFLVSETTGHPPTRSLHQLLLPQGSSLVGNCLPN